jgi:hypothetical protein
LKKPLQQNGIFVMVNYVPTNDFRFGIEDIEEVYYYNEEMEDNALIVHVVCKIRKTFAHIMHCEDKCIVQMFDDITNLKHCLPSHISSHIVTFSKKNRLLNYFFKKK